MPSLIGMTLPDGGAKERPDLLGMIHHAGFPGEDLVDTARHDASRLAIGWSARRSAPTGMAVHRSPDGKVTVYVLGHLIGRVGREDRPGFLTERYEERGAEFLRNLNGSFLIVVADDRTKTVYAANDRYGQRRLFHHRDGNRFAFGSNAGALLRGFPGTREFDPDGVAEYLSCGSTLGDRSLYAGISVAGPGTLIEIPADGVPRFRRYFEPSEWEDLDTIETAMFEKRFIEAFTETSRRYVSGDPPTALSLTGGLDSRMVLAAACPDPGTLPCYTFSSVIRDSLDVSIARAVAKRADQPFTALAVDEGFFEDIPGMLERTVVLSDGYIGLSGAAELYVNSRAKEVAPVRVTGNYGSEFIRRIRAFKSGPPNPLIVAPDYRAAIERAGRRFADIEDASSDASFVAFHQIGSQGYGRFAVENSQLELVSPFIDNELAALYYRMPPVIDGVDLAGKIIAAHAPRLLDVTTDRGYFGRRPDLLRPLKRLIREFNFKAEYVIGQAAPAWYVKRESLFRRSGFERLFLGRNKFYHSRIYYRDHLREYTREAFADPDTPYRLPFLRWENIGRLVEDHFTGKLNENFLIDRLLPLVVSARMMFRD